LKQELEYYASLKPGSPEWKTARERFDVNGSEAAAATRVNKYKSLARLWKEKKKIMPPEDLDDNPVVQWGVDNEETARFEFQCMMALDYPDYELTQPGITAYAKDMRYAASLDNLAICKKTGKKFVVEYKCPQALYNEVPVHYMIQIQCQMEYADADFCFLWVWRPEMTRYWVIDRNQLFFDRWIYPKLVDFSNKLASNVEPPRMRPGERERLIEEVKSFFPEVYGENF
jgi:putative phage-type endonuclease